MMVLVKAILKKTVLETIRIDDDDGDKSNTDTDSHDC